MDRQKQYFVYIMTNASKTLYTGVTNDLVRRVYEHKHKLVKGFTAKYNMTRLVCYEALDDIREAIAREKRIKGWLRAKKVALVESTNPEWKDLSTEWFPEDSSCYPEPFACHPEWNEGSQLHAQGKLREGSLRQGTEILRGVYPERKVEMLRGACPEDEILRVAQNDRRRAQHDRQAKGSE